MSYNDEIDWCAGRIAWVNAIEDGQIVIDPASLARYGGIEGLRKFRDTLSKTLPVLQELADKESPPS